MIFIKQIIGKLVQDQVLQIVKDPHNDNFGYVDKIMPIFSFLFKFNKIFRW